MYNAFTSGYIPENVIEQLEAIEAQADVPLRMVATGRYIDENRWEGAHLGEYERTHARENGWTIAFGEPCGGVLRYPWLCFSETNHFEILEPFNHDGFGDSLIWDDPDGWTTRRREDNGYATTNCFGAVDYDRRVIQVWFSLPNYSYSGGREPGIDALWNIIIDTLEQGMGPDGLTDEERETRRQERTQAAFNRYVERVYNGQIQSRRRAIDTRTAEITAAQTAIARQTAALIQDQQLLDALLTVQANDAAATMRQEFELLASHPRLESRALRDGTKLVLTTTDDLRLTREDTGESRWLGQFKITFDLQTFDINIQNLNTMRGGRHHPHIPGDGRPCFGSYANSFYELLGQGQLYVCFDLLLQYIETVNLRDEWGRYASYWFEVEDERPLETTNTEELVTA